MVITLLRIILSLLASSNGEAPNAEVGTTFLQPPLYYTHGTDVPRHWNYENGHNRLFPDYDCNSVPVIEFRDSNSDAGLHYTYNPVRETRHYRVDFAAYLSKVQKIFHREIYMEQSVELRLRKEEHAMALVEQLPEYKVLTYWMLREQGPGGNHESTPVEDASQRNEEHAEKKSHEKKKPSFPQSPNTVILQEFSRHHPNITLAAIQCPLGILFTVAVNYIRCSSDFKHWFARRQYAQKFMLESGLSGLFSDLHIPSTKNETAYFHGSPRNMIPYKRAKGYKNGDGNPNQVAFDQVLRLEKEGNLLEQPSEVELQRQHEIELHRQQEISALLDPHRPDLAITEPKVMSSFYMKYHLLDGRKWEACNDWKRMLANVVEIIDNKLKPILYSRWPLLLILTKTNTWRDENFSGIEWFDRIIGSPVPSYNEETLRVGWKKYHERFVGKRFMAVEKGMKDETSNAGDNNTKHVKEIIEDDEMHYNDFHRFFTLSSRFVTPLSLESQSPEGLLAYKILQTDHEKLPQEILLELFPRESSSVNGDLNADFVARMHARLEQSAQIRTSPFSTFYHDPTVRCELPYDATDGTVKYVKAPKMPTLDKIREMRKQGLTEVPVGLFQELSVYYGEGIPKAKSFTEVEFLYEFAEVFKYMRAVGANEENEGAYGSGVDMWVDKFAEVLFDFFLESNFSDAFFDRMQDVCIMGYWVYIVYRVLISFRSEPESGEQDWKIVWSIEDFRFVFCSAT